LQPLRLLFWLKWKLMLRGYRRNPSSAIGAVLMLLFFFPLAVVLALLCAEGFTQMAPPNNANLLRAVLLGIYLLWLLGPTMGYALNESYDITRLFVYPLSLRQIFAGAMLGSLLDVPVLLLLPTLIAILTAFTRDGPSFVFSFCAVGLFLLHTLSLSQTVILAGAGILRSRRFRDLVTVLIPLVWILWYIFTQTLSRHAGPVDWTTLLGSPAWNIVNYLPPGFAARAVVAAERGQYVVAAGFLLALSGVTVGTVYLAAWLLQKIYAGDILTRPAGARAPAPPPAVSAPSRPVRVSSGPFAGMLPPVLQAVMAKEIRYLFRDPYFKIVLMNLVYMLVAAGFGVVNTARDERFALLSAGMVLGGTWMLLLGEMQVICNLFGTEGSAASLLFLFPASRRQIILGKNLAFFVALSAINLTFLVILAALGHAFRWIGLLLCWMELALVACLALGNLVSVYFPYRMVLKGWRVRQQYAARGCGYSLIYLLVVAGAFFLLLPVLAALIAPMFWIEPWWWAVTIPLAVGYALGLYALSLYQAGPLLERRETEIIAKVAQED